MAIQKVILEKISRYTKDRDGKPLKTSDGRNYERVLLTVKGETISGFGNQSNADWKAGDEVQIDITKVEKNGKTFYNFSPVNVTSLLVNRIEELEKKVANLESKLLTSSGDKVPDFSEIDEVLEEPPLEAFEN